MRQPCHLIRLLQLKVITYQSVHFQPSVYIASWSVICYQLECWLFAVLWLSTAAVFATLQSPPPSKSHLTAACIYIWATSRQMKCICVVSAIFPVTKLYCQLVACYKFRANRFSPSLPLLSWYISRYHHCRGFINQNVTCKCSGLTKTCGMFMMRSRHVLTYY